MNRPPFVLSLSEAKLCRRLNDARRAQRRAMFAVLALMPLQAAPFVLGAWALFVGLHYALQALLVGDLP